MAKRVTLAEVLLDRKRLREKLESANKRMETLTWQATQDRDAARDAIVEQASAESRERSLRGELEAQIELVSQLRKLEQELYREKADLRKQLEEATQRSVEDSKQFQTERHAWQLERTILRDIITLLAGKG